MTVLNTTTTESTAAYQNVVINIPNAQSVQSVTSNTGAVGNYSLAGSNLTVFLYGGAITRTANVTGDQLINFDYLYFIGTSYGYSTLGAAQAYSLAQCDAYNNKVFTDVYGNTRKVSAYDDTYVYMVYDYSGGNGSSYHAAWQMGRFIRQTITISLDYYQYNLTINYTLINQAPNAPTITAPTAEQHVITRTPTITWVFTDSDVGNTQSAFNIQVVNGAYTSVVWDSGWINDSSSSYKLPIGAIPQDGDFWVRMQVKDQSGLVNIANGSGPDPSYQNRHFYVDTLLLLFSPEF